jgi:hypothetical protein
LRWAALFRRVTQLHGEPENESDDGVTQKPLRGEEASSPKREPLQ